MIVLFFITGLLFGSFLNAWVWRTREGLSVLKGRSVCPSCKKELTWAENIPLLSFLLQRGECKRCKKPISWQYPLVELTIGLLFAFAAWQHGGNIEFILRDSFIIFFLTFVFVYDLRYQEIWDRMTMWPAFMLLIATAVFGWHSWRSVLLGVIVGAGVFLLQYIVSKGKWIGGGDIRLGMFMGVILGLPLTVLAIFLAYVGGALFILPFLIFGKKKFASKIPFGTYLSVATVVAMFWGESILEWYVGFIF